ncbi:M48 family metallopeptidase [Methylovulum miyakonense]|uniref:M48 family metallopeptidase n=1 Tax=Methylovulum miyakonense TaxID=645578 RepID=UPI000360803D|nr:SprT family zinc-dependent metalloprotease [Methylovulum miyakonense]
MQQTIRYGSEEIHYQVTFLTRKTSKIVIHIHPDGRVQVDAPEDADLQQIKQAVLKRARWLSLNLFRIREARSEVLPRQYISGESHFYLGKRYPLKIVALANNHPPTVKLLRGQLHVATADRSSEKVRQLLKDWYASHARQVFHRRLNALVPSVLWLNGESLTIKLLTMKKQWGSCSPQGHILLNPHLIKAPTECIDYVIIHELCHLKEHNHSPEFYRLLSLQMPGWKQIKIKLDGMAELLLNY